MYATTPGRRHCIARVSPLAVLVNWTANEPGTSSQDSGVCTLLGTFDMGGFGSSLKLMLETSSLASENSD